MNTLNNYVLYILVIGWVSVGAPTTILPSSILYGVWHTKGGSVAGRILRNGRAIVPQYGRRCGWGGGNKRMIYSTIQL